MRINILFERVPIKYEALIFALVTIPLIMMHYWSHPRDMGAYIQGGIQILAGQDPYEDRVFRGGAFGAVMLALLFRGIPESLQAYIFLFLSLLGAWIFTRTFINSTLLNLFLCVIVVWSSANRTNLDTIQLTGLLMGLISLIYLEINTEKVNSNLFSLFLISALSAILLDSKPHITLPFVILLGFWAKKFAFLFLTLSILLFGHIFVGFIFGFEHFKNWLFLIFEIGQNQRFEQFDGAAHNYWQILTFLSSSFTNWTQLVPFFAYFSILGLSIISIRKFTFLGVCTLSMLCIGITSYSHFYDFVPIVVIILILLKEKNFSGIEFGIVMFILLPQNWSDLPKLIIVLGIVVIYGVIRIHESLFYEQVDSFKIRTRVFRYALEGILFYSCIQILNSYLPLPIQLIDAVTTTEIFLLFVVMVLVRRRTLLSI
jgi:hypothetical protein